MREELLQLDQSEFIEAIKFQVMSLNLSMTEAFQIIDEYYDRPQEYTDLEVSDYENWDV